MAKQPEPTAAENSMEASLSLAQQMGVVSSSERDPWQAQLDILGRFMKATTVDELFAVHEGQSADELKGKRFRLIGVTWDTYASDKGDIPLAQVEAVNIESGEKHDFRTTSLNLTGFIRGLDVHGLFPCDVLVEGVKTNSGQTALRFVRP